MLPVTELPKFAPPTMSPIDSSIALLRHAAENRHNMLAAALATVDEMRGPMMDELYNLADSARTAVDPKRIGTVVVQSVADVTSRTDHSVGLSSSASKIFAETGKLLAVANGGTK